MKKKKISYNTKSVKSIQITPENVKYSLTSQSALGVLMVVDVRSSAGKILFDQYYCYCTILDAASLPSLSAQPLISPLSSLLSLRFHSSHLKKEKKKYPPELCHNCQTHLPKSM